MANEQHKTWPDLAVDLYDKLTGRGAEITYEFENLEVYVPGGTAPGEPQAHWKLNGVLKIRARDTQS